VKIGGKPRDHDRHAIDLGDFDDRASFFRSQEADRPEQPTVLVRWRDVQPMHENRPMTLNFLREKAPGAPLSDRLEELVLGYEFCACHRTQQTHTLGTASDGGRAELAVSPQRGRPVVRDHYIALETRQAQRR
jgi:hypothetical protein